MTSLSLVWTIVGILFISSVPHSLSLSTKTRREVITTKHGAVATDDGRCSLIGSRVLREGGHAVDALVASALCLGVVSAASSGIGGGAFLLVRLADGNAQAFDMRETAPLQASENMYAGNASLKASGALSVGVPGELAGLYDAWRQHGRLPWKRLVRPAERLAEKGFKISRYLHMQMERTRLEILSDEGLRSVYTSDGELLRPGSICKNKKLAQTLRLIRTNGPQVFYNGSVGFNLVEDVRKVGGILSMRDLESYRVKVKEPISAEIFGYRILGMPPPSSGGVGMVLILNILAQYEISKDASSSRDLHRFVEALKHLFAVRMNLGDPDFVDISKVTTNMLSVEFAEELRKVISDDRTFNSSYYGGRWQPIYDHGTSHLSIVDKNRNAVSMTSTVNSYFGARILSPSTGIVLNNEMDDFSIPGNGSSSLPPPAPANFIRPAKRPLSSMTPTIVVKDGQLKAVAGASGGAYIIAATTEVLLNQLVRGMDPLSSVMAPRFYHQLVPNVLQYENWTTVIGDHFEVPIETRRSLEKKGHVLQSLAGGTICQLVVHTLKGPKTAGGVILGELTAVSDPRKAGFPSGY